MKIYTKTGDAGTTGLLGGGRVPKDDGRIEACGTVDELNAQLGVARSCAEHEELDRILAELQNQLFTVGAALAAPDPVHPRAGVVDATLTEWLEQTIDRLESGLPPLREFILPAGSAAAASLHAARAVCRRAERRVVTLYAAPRQPAEAELICYLNRLGDLLFVMARWANQLSGVPDVAWAKPQPRD